MGDLGKLFGYRSVDCRVGVAVDVDPERGNAVEVASAVCIDELVSFRAVDDERRVLHPLVHGRERMPKVLAVKVV